MVSISIKPLHSLEEILKYENAIWTKISQPRLEELLKGHEDYIQGYLGEKRASLKFLDMSYLDLSGKDLTQADATGSELKHATMKAAVLRATNL
jgi:uncharacterized protein YjbI with pentapeptide repeats